MRLLQTRKGMRIRQRGVVLVMSLILLVIVSLVGAMAIRSAISGEQVSKSFRSNAVASQAAETALRYCEDQVLRSTGAVIVNPLPVSGGGAELWKTRSNWASSARAIRIPAEVVNSSQSAARKLGTAQLPRCMVEQYPLLSVAGALPRQSYLVTAVGYSADYSENAAGIRQSGSEVWLQSMLRR